MEIAQQIKALRLRRGITQEAMAQHFGITAQAVSKWERGSAAPDISLLPALSAYFGVTIDELFALSDATRMERIENMLWDVRFLNAADVENERNFLLAKAEREPNNSAPLELLALLEWHLSQEHCTHAKEHALHALKRNPYSASAQTLLAHAMHGRHVDWNQNNHNELISHYEACIKAHPDALNAYLWLIEQLLADGRIDEARHYCDAYEQQHQSHRIAQCRIKIAFAGGDRATAKALWEKMQQDYADNWSVQHDVGDWQARNGEYAAAKESYRRAMDLQSAPRKIDPLISLALVCEMKHDYQGALAALNEQLLISQREWHILSGESIDEILREIERIKKLI